MPNKIIDMWGEKVEVAISSEATNNASCTVIQTSPPGGGPMVHMHTREDEVLLVLEGDYAYYDGESWHNLRPGKPHFLVRDRPHTYRNIGHTTGRMLVFAAPGGLDDYFATVASLSLPRDQQRFEDISRNYGVTVLPDETPPNLK